MTQMFDDELRQGLVNHWYAICQSAHLNDQPLGLKRLGVEIVLWRDSAGRTHVHRDTCLHRGAKLSLGKVVHDQLRCAYHGWTYNGSGQCTTIPASRKASESLAPRLCLETYESQERAGLVWAYFPDERRGAAPTLVIPEELERPDWSGFICENLWQANWLLVLENLADPMHGPFLHSESLTLSRGAREDEMRTVEKDGGFIVERVGQRGVNFDWSEIYGNGTLWIRLDIPLPWGPKGPLRILCMVTPIDEESSLVYFLRYRHLTGWRRAYWRFLYKTFWERQHAKVIDQDRLILESQRGAQSRLSEHLSNSDRGVTEIRRFLRDKVREHRG